MVAHRTYGHRRRFSLFSRLRGAAGPAGVILLLAYFSYHAVQGNYGLLALRGVNDRHAELSEQAARLASERAALEARVDLLRPQHVDPDMLDEQVRRSLGFIRPDESVILLDPAE